MQQLGPYRLGEELGRGGAGVVFRAQDQRTGQIVALKVLLEQHPNPVRLERFRREGMALYGVEHPHLVRVLGLSTEPPCPYVAFEYVPGETLQGRVDREGPLRWQVAVQIVSQVAEGLAVAHARSLLHRDIKPSNVLLGEAGAKLADFGLVKDLDLDSLTRSGGFLGTPAYMSPEQVAVQRGSLTPATDVYGLAATLHFAVVGAPPFRAATAVATLLEVETAPVKSLRRAQPDVPGWLDAVCRRGLAKRPEDRFASAEAFRDALQAGRAGSGVRGPRWWIPAGAAAGVLCTVGLWAASGRRGAAGGHPPPTAQREAVAQVDPGPVDSPAPDPQSSEDTERTTRFTLGIGDRLEALAALDRAVGLEPTNASLYDQRGAARERLGQLSGAIEDLTLAIELQRTADRHAARGAIYLALEEFEQALMDFNHAVWLEPSVEAHLRRGALHARLGHADEALEDYAEALERDPQHVEARTRKVRLLVGLGRGNESLADCAHLLSQAPSAEIYRIRGVIHTARNAHSEAERDLTQAIELDPGFVDAYRDRASCYALQGRLDPALADYTRALELDPHDVQSLHYRGSILLNLGRNDEALADLSRMVEVAPSAKAYLTRGVARYNLTRYSEALEDFQQARKLEPQSAFHPLYCGMAKSRLGRAEEALADYTHALELDPRAEAWAPRGRALASLGRHTEALADLTRALELEPERASLYADRSRSHAAVGQREAAIEDCERALKLGLPDDASADEVRLRLEALRGPH